MGRTRMPSGISSCASTRRLFRVIICECLGGTILDDNSAASANTAQILLFEIVYEAGVISAGGRSFGNLVAFGEISESSKFRGPLVSLSIRRTRAGSPIAKDIN